jgi:hypothetical protein
MRERPSLDMYKRRESGNRIIVGARGGVERGGGLALALAGGLYANI